MDEGWWFSVAIAVTTMMASWYVVYRLGYRVGFRQGFKEASVAAKLWLLDRLLDFRKEPDESETT